MARGSWTRGHCSSGPARVAGALSLADPAGRLRRLTIDYGGGRLMVASAGLAWDKQWP